MAAAAINMGTGTLFLNTDASGFDKGLQQSQQRAMKTTKAIGAAFTAMGAVITGVLIKSVKSYITAGDEVQKMALRTGFATETLSELGHAASLGGSDLASLEKGVKRMQRTIFEAGDEAARAAKTGKEATGEYTDALRFLGLEYTDLKGKSPEQQFMILAGRLADVEDATDKAAIAQLVFGRAGTEMLPMLASGSAGLAAAAAEARKLGIVFDQEAANKAAALTDQLFTLKQSFMGMAFQIADVLIPILLEWIPKITEVITNTIAWMQENQALVATIVKVAAVVGGLMLVLGPILIMLPGLIALFGGGAGLAGAVGGLTAIIPALGSAFTLLAANPLVLVAAAAAIVAGIIIKLTLDIKAAEAALAQHEAQTRKNIAAIQEHGVKLSELAQQEEYNYAAGKALGEANLAHEIALYEAKGVVFDEAIMKEMDFYQKRQYMAEESGRQLAEMAQADIDAVVIAGDEIVAVKENTLSREWEVLEGENAMATAGQRYMADNHKARGVILDESLMANMNYAERKGYIHEQLLAFHRGETESQQESSTAMVQTVDDMATQIESSTIQAKTALSQLSVDTAPLEQSANQAVRTVDNMVVSIAKSLARGGLSHLEELTGIDIPYFAGGTKGAPGGLAVVGEQGPELVNLPRGSEVSPARETAQKLGATNTVNVNMGGVVVRSEADMDTLSQKMAWRIGNELAAAGAA